MYWIICRLGVRPYVEYPFKARWTDRLKLGNGWTFGRYLVMRKDTTGGREMKYTKALRALILECLMGEPRLRPTPKEILERIERHMKAVDDLSFEDIEVPDEHYFEEEKPAPPAFSTQPSGARFKVVDLRSRADEPSEEQYVVVHWSNQQHTTYDVSFASSETTTSFLSKLWDTVILEDRDRRRAMAQALRDVEKQNARLEIRSQATQTVLYPRPQSPLGQYLRGGEYRLDVRFA